MLRQSRISKAVGAVVVAVLALGALAVAASAHRETTAPSITCASVSASFADFGQLDHPVVWQVRIGNGAFQAVATHDFVGPSGTASADISNLTAILQGVPTVIQVFVTWPGHTGNTVSANRDMR